MSETPTETTESTPAPVKSKSKRVTMTPEQHERWLAMENTTAAAPVAGAEVEIVVSYPDGLEGKGTFAVVQTANVGMHEGEAVIAGIIAGEPAWAFSAYTDAIPAFLRVTGADAVTEAAGTLIVMDTMSSRLVQLVGDNHFVDVKLEEVSDGK